MNKTEVLQLINSSSKSKDLVDAINSKYNCQMPDILERLVSCCGEGIHLDKDRRVLSYGEILNPESVHPSLFDNNLIPVVDCFDNDYIVYDYANDRWSIYNIDDEIVFLSEQKLEDLL